MKHLLCCFLLVFGSSMAFPVGAWAWSEKEKQPNFVVILSDDMGFSDLGCFGGEIETPHLDGLARDGIRFTQFYNTARCCPTRASLLTGLYPHQAGVGHMMEDKGYAGYRGDLSPACRTIPEMLQPAGYRSYAVGKWHVTRHAGANGPKQQWPLQRGFTGFYGTIHGAGSFFDPSSLVRDNTMISPMADPLYEPDQYYYTDAISEHAIRYIRNHTQSHSEAPFFLYVAYTAAHWPMHALPEDIAKYDGRYDEGYQVIRGRRFEKGVKLGVMMASQPPSPPARDWETVEDKVWEAACMEVYAAMVDRMDQGIGQIIGQLKAAGVYEDTVILYLQDNGGCAEDMGRKGRENHPNIARPDQPLLPPMQAADLAAAGSVPAQTRDGYPVRMGPKVMPGPADTYVAYGEGWANVSNTPFRQYKHWVHEGGISTPLIVHWPAGIRNRGVLRDQPAHLIDIATTLIDLAGADAAAKLPSLEGVSLVPALAGEPLEREALYWEHEGNRAVRSGNWKLVAKHRGPWELYDLATDRVESRNLAAEQPEVLQRLEQMYQAYAARCLVQPWPVESKRLDSR